MQLAKFPRGREYPRAIDAAPVPDPHGPGHEYTEGSERVAPPDPGSERVAVPIAHADAFQVTAEPRAAKAPEAPAEPETLAEPDWKGWKVTDEFGRTVGKVESADHPEWLVVRDRRGRHLLAPSEQAISGSGSVFLPYEADLIAAAPRLEGDDLPDEETAAAARAHYG